MVHTLGAPARRVLSRETALAVGQKLLDMIGTDAHRVSIEHNARTVTHVANGRVLSSHDGDLVRIVFDSEAGSGVPVFITTNQLHDDTLRWVVEYARAIAPAKLRPAGVQAQPLADDKDDGKYFMFNARPIPPVSLWHDTTVRAMDTVHGEVIPKLVEDVRVSKLSGAATVGLMARSVLHLYKLGLTAFAEETDSEVTVTARTPDGTGSGWGGQAHRDWARVKPDVAVTQAIDIANRSRGMVAVEPGRRTAILGPAAVAQLVGSDGMINAFNYMGAKLGGGQFSLMPPDAKGRRTKLGQRVFDSRLVMVSDPADPAGGFAPFFEKGNFIELDILGFPTPAVKWVDHGVLTNMAHSVAGAAGLHLSPSDLPLSVHLSTVPGTDTATIEEMIANCTEGIYVNRFSQVNIIDWRTGMLTGVTRDGCFLIKNGKIEKPVKNFRFLESPFFALNKIEMIGTSERVAFGYNASSPEGPMTGNLQMRWPRLPVIVPPMMIRDFNFSGLSDAV